MSDRREDEPHTTALLRRVWDKVSASLPRPKKLPALLGFGVEPGTLIGRWRVERELGRGANGIVYRVVETKSGDVRALKLISNRGPQDPARRRFDREVEAVRTLDHPNLLTVVDSGAHEGQAWLVTELVDGRTFEEVLVEREAAGRRLPVEALRPNLAILLGVLEGVAFAHARNVIHRDLKPANVLLDGTGRPRVTDFGLAKRTDSVDRITVSGEVLGTPSYMAPEQATGKLESLGSHTDVFALGVVLYRILAGRLPFRAKRPMELFHLISQRDPAPPRRENPDVPVELERICMKALAKDPRDRFPDATAFAADLRRFLAGLPVSTRPIRGGRLGRTLLAAGIAALLLAGAAALVLHYVR